MRIEFCQYLATRAAWNDGVGRVRNYRYFSKAGFSRLNGRADGDPRAGYLLIDNGEAEVIRVEYDIEREVNTVLSSGYPDAERIAAMRRRGEFVAPSS